MHNHDLLRLISKKVGYKSIEIPSKLSTRIMESAGKITSWLITKSKSYKKTGDRKLKIGSKKDSKEIEEYRKTIKIFDIFTFFNELELLEIRLNMLAPFVDYFVIVECRQTFSGRKKPLYYDLNKDKFKKFDKKIIHYVVTGVPDSEEDLIKRLNRHTDPLEREIINYELTTDNFNKGETHWLKEFYQKESIRKALSVCKDNDICFVSDVDEIWNPEAAIDYRRDDVFKLKQTVYSYYLNNRSSEPWAGTLVTKYKNIKHNCLNHLRTARKTKYTFIENGGWHFTNQGGMERVIKKLESYGHQEFNTPEIKEKIGERIHENRDFIGRNFKFWLDESGLPEYILKNRNKYLNFFKNE